MSVGSVASDGGGTEPTTTLEDYARQVSHDFEQIQFLLSLSEHLELCELERSVCDVAESVVPVLRDLIGAKTVVAVPAEEGSARGSCAEAGAGSGVYWFGPRVLPDPLVVRLVERFGSTAVQQPVVRNRLAGKREFEEFPGLHSFLLAAVGTGQSCTGWLLALNRELPPDSVCSPGDYPAHGLSAYEFGTVEAGMATAVAAMLATHGRNLRFIEERESLLTGALRALINAVDAKDSYTCGHSDRVALIARRLGQEMGLPAQQCQQLYLAGLLHDIGKIGIPDAVLTKPGRLTDGEFARIQQHPGRGHAILNHLKHIEGILPGVLHHHERWDGRGYPGGLSGPEIPLPARIIAVADAYDAMTSTRAYRKAMPEEKVEAILRDGAGSQWDPEVIQALFRALPDVRAICQRAEGHTRKILNQDQPAEADRQEPAEDSLVGAVKGIRNP